MSDKTTERRSRYVVAGVAPRLHPLLWSSCLLSALGAGAARADAPLPGDIGFGYFTAAQTGKSCLQVVTRNATLSVPVNGQTATDVVAVVVTNDNGVAIPGVAVTLQMLAGNSTLQTPTGTTDATGKYQSNVARGVSTSSAVVGALYDSGGSGVANTPVVFGNPATVSFATGG